jgi:hypothetical protein
MEKLSAELQYMVHGVQILSLIGSVLILSAYVCKGEMNIRLVNTAGCVFCIIYSLFTAQWSNLILNVIVACINIYNITTRKAEMAK